MTAGDGAARATRRQLVAGLLALPLSVLPFMAYATLTPEGSLLRDKAMVFLDPPELPELAAGLRRSLAGDAPMYEDGVMPLVYHGIGSGTAAEGDFAISPDRFAEHIATLKAAGMNFVTARQVAAAFDGGRRLPANAVMVTFDDGRTDALMWATPLLRQAKAKATMFVISGAADDPGFYYADWKALTKSDDVWDVQSHTAELHVEHDAAGGRPLPALTSRAEGESISEFRARVEADLERADDAILENTGRRPVAFAYPFGAWGADRHNDGRIRGVLADIVGDRYRLAFHQDDQREVPVAMAGDTRTGLRRLSVGDWSGKQLLRQIAAAVSRTPALGLAGLDELSPSGIADSDLGGVSVVDPLAAAGAGVADAEAVAGVVRPSGRSTAPAPAPVSASPAASPPTAPPPAPAPAGPAPAEPPPPDDPPPAEEPPDEEPPTPEDDRPGNGNGRDNPNAGGPKR